MKAGQCYVVLIGGWNQHVDLVREWERMHHWLFGGRQMQGISVHLRLYSWLGLIQTSLKDRKRRKMKPTALSGSYPPRIHFMEYYETRTEVFVLWSNWKWQELSYLGNGQILCNFSCEQSASVLVNTEEYLCYSWFDWVLFSSNKILGWFEYYVTRNNGVDSVIESRHWFWQDRRCIYKRLSETVDSVYPSGLRPGKSVLYHAQKLYISYLNLF